MEEKMKKVMLILALCFLIVPLVGATPAFVNWRLAPPDSQQVSAVAGNLVGLPQIGCPGFVVRDYAYGPGPDQRWWPANNVWLPAPNQVDTLWVQFGVCTKVNVSLHADSFTLFIGAKGTGNLRANVWYATDSQFNNPIQLNDSILVLVKDDHKFYNFAINTDLPVGDTLFVRIYPWFLGSSPATGKYLYLLNATLWGTTAGSSEVNPPTVTTAPVSYISTTTALSGGTVTDDGGAPVEIRGVCWNSSGTPTIDDSTTTDGAGGGAFVSHLAGLTPGLTYYLRAYATNSGGTAYGEELSFQTLENLTVPSVTTAPVSDIMVNTAQCGGNVTAWGGDTVTVRGICWNLSGDPTVADFKTVNGSGLGSFTSLLYPLQENTTYYVRAYATNSVGTGYGEVQTFTTQLPAPEIVKIVAADGSGDYTQIQAAFDAIPNYYTGTYIIYVKKGVYREKLLLDRTKPNVILVGENRDSTILTYDDYAGKAGGTSNSYSVAIDADDFVAIDITFRNTVKNDGSFPDQQAVALRVNGDRQSYYNCRLLGYQDTYYTWGGRGTGRIYMHQCYIEGAVDFIFGRDIVVFDSCEIHINRDGGTLTAASTEVESQFGYVFRDCKITADSIGFNRVPITSFYLGRPWQAAPRTVFIRCEEPAALAPAGWLTWNVTPALYAEYQCYGPGSEFSQRLALARQLTNEEAAGYTLEKIFAKDSNPNLAYDWLPARPVITIPEVAVKSSVLKAGEYHLFQNFPNPFNSWTTIQYHLPQTARVNLTLYNILGEKVRTLVDETQKPGLYTFSLDGGGLPSGIYFIRFATEYFHQCRKVLLLK